MALDEMLELLGKNNAVKDKDALRRAIYEREKIASTGIGYEVAIPHARLAEVDGLVAALGIFPDGVDFDAIDEQPVKIIFAVAAHIDMQEDYTRLVARIGRFLIKEHNRKTLVRCASVDEVMALIGAFDNGELP